MCDEGECGALLRFDGVIRADRHGEHQVSHMHYSCYEAMLSEQAEKGVLEVATRFQLQHVRVWHSLDVVSVGEASLVVLLAARHRKHCFSAMEEVVRLIKTTWPIWGTEYLDDGSTVAKRPESPL